MERRGVAGLSQPHPDEDPSPQSSRSPAPPHPHPTSHPTPPPPHHHCAPTGVIRNWTDERRLPPCTIFQAFKYYLDITTPPTPLQLQQFASLATSEKEKQQLLVLSKVGPGPLQPQGALSAGSAWPSCLVLQRTSSRWQS